MKRVSLEAGKFLAAHIQSSQYGKVLALVVK